jgi:hypothetical protein
MKTKNKQIRIVPLVASLAVLLMFSGQAFAVDDGARAYWNARSGTNAFSFQYLRWDIHAADAQQFDPAHYIYMNADTELSVFAATYVRHINVLRRASSLSLNVMGGDVDVSVNSKMPMSFVPPGKTPAAAFSESSSGYADPSMQFVINLFGTSQLKNNVHLLNYEPGVTVDAAVMLGIPIGEYDNKKLVNMGLNRWFGRVALPLKYHFGVFAPGYMSSLEVTPSVWLFEENDDFLGQKLDNEPLFQLEAHLTHDFTRTFFASIDMLMRNGFQSEINDVEVGEDLNVGNIGFTFNYQVNDNMIVRNSFSSNVFGDEAIDNSIVRIQFAYMWNTSNENSKKLLKGHH